MRDFYEWYLAAGLEVVNLNNAGDPMTDEPWAMSSHVFEREVIDYFAPLYGFDKSDVWGIVTAPEAQAYYGEFLRGVLNAKGGVLWHCSQGKDRAGWASAFVLAALGAERKVIVEDFDLTNQSYASKVDALLTLLPDKEGRDEAEAFIRAMIGVSRENFEATLDLIDQQYGSMSQYIENQLGFSKKEQQQLKEKYLTKKW